MPASRSGFSCSNPYLAIAPTPQRLAPRTITARATNRSRRPRGSLEPPVIPRRTGRRHRPAGALELGEQRREGSKRVVAWSLLFAKTERRRLSECLRRSGVRDKQLASRVAAPEIDLAALLCRKLAALWRDRHDLHRLGPEVGCALLLDRSGPGAWGVEEIVGRLGVIRLRAPGDLLLVLLRRQEHA